MVKKIYYFGGGSFEVTGNFGKFLCKRFPAQVEQVPTAEKSLERDFLLDGKPRYKTVETKALLNTRCMVARRYLSPPAERGCAVGRGRSPEKLQLNVRSGGLRRTAQPKLCGLENLRIDGSVADGAR